MRKRFVFVIIFIIFFMILHVLKINTSNANSNQYLATDKSIFGNNALILNSQEDQSEKLEECIKKAALDRKELIIPTGKYYINKSINLRTGNVQIIGDINDATILVNKDSTKRVYFYRENIQDSIEKIEIKNILFESVDIYIKNNSNITIENNIFYNLTYVFMVYINGGKNININHNIFLRDLEHALATAATEARVIHVGGYDADNLIGSQYKWTENVNIKDNLIGAKINELDAIKSLQQENKKNIEKLQKLIKEGRINLKNEQNLVTNGINSFATLKNAYIERNVFYSNYDDYGLGKN